MSPGTGTVQTKCFRCTIWNVERIHEPQRNSFYLPSRFRKHSMRLVHSEVTITISLIVEGNSGRIYVYLLEKCHNKQRNILSSVLSSTKDWLVIIYSWELQDSVRRKVELGNNRILASNSISLIKQKSNKWGMPMDNDTYLTAYNDSLLSFGLFKFTIAWSKRSRYTT